MRKGFILVYLMLRVALLPIDSTAQSGKAAVNPNQQPNIIFFFTDDQAYDTQKDFGNPDVKTPNMDKLADEGMVFTRHYNTTAICMASRANVMIGQYEYKTGCNFEHGPMKPEKWENAYPLLLKEAGYSVGFGGKFGFSIAENRDNHISGTG